MGAFVTAIEAAEDFDLKQFKVDMTRDTVIERLLAFGTYPPATDKREMQSCGPSV